MTNSDVADKIVRNGEEKGRLERVLFQMQTRLEEVEPQGRQHIEEVISLRRRISDARNKIAELVEKNERLSYKVHA